MGTGVRGRAPLTRVPGSLNLVAAAALLLILVPFALRAAQSSPPAIAEFAPQAEEPIKQAPGEQSSNAGSAPGGAANEPGAVASASPLQIVPSPEVERGKVRQCIGEPPRQIEDPQSPPCVPYFSGSNGGATAKGVTGSQIVIAL